jgi:hypothetical protein
MLAVRAQNWNGDPLLSCGVIGPRRGLVEGAERSPLKRNHPQHPVGEVRGVRALRETGGTGRTTTPLTQWLSAIRLRAGAGRAAPRAAPCLAPRAANRSPAASAGSRYRGSHGVTYV